MNSCEEVREFLLECDWSEGGLQLAFDALEHVQNCPQCAAVAREYARVRAALKAETPGVPEGGWDAMEQRLLSKSLHPRKAVHFPWRALAASLLIAAIGYGMGRFSADTASRPAAPISLTPTPKSPEVADAFTQSDIVRRVKAFDEVSGVFEHKTSWLVVGDDMSDVGISDKVMDHQEQVLLLRLTMLESGKIISSTDLVILPGQTANLVVPANTSTSLHYRISTSEDQPTRLAISTQLTTPKGTEVLAALATSLQLEPGQKLSAGTMVTNDGNYELQVAFGRADLNRPDAASKQ